MGHCFRLVRWCQLTLGRGHSRSSCLSYTGHRKIQHLNLSTCSVSSRELKKTSGQGNANPSHHPGVHRPGVRGNVSHRAAAFDSTVLEVTEDHLLMKDEGGDSVKIPFYWLRDNCRCSSCFHAETSQILHNIVDLDLDVKATDMQSDSHEVTITWSDSHKSVFSHTWLREHAPGVDNLFHGRHGTFRTLWQGSRFKMPSFTLSDLKGEKAVLKKFLKTLHEYGVALIGGVEPSEESHSDVSKFVMGGIQSTFYSPDVCKLSPGLEIADLAYTNLGIPLHTDTTYFDPPCRGMSLQVTERSREGGRTIISDGFYALERLRFNHPEYFQNLCNTDLETHYLDETRDIRNSEPIVKVNPYTKQIERIRFNPFDRTTITNVPYELMLDFYKAFQALAREIYDDENAFKVLLEPDQLVICDNWRVLHARESFTGHRVLLTAFLRHDDWMSQMRKIGGLEV